MIQVAFSAHWDAVSSTQTLLIFHISVPFGILERPPHHDSTLSKGTCVFFKVTLPTDSSIVRGDFVEVAESQRIFPSLSASVILFLYLFGWSGPKLSVWAWFNDSLLFLFLCHVFAPSLTFCFSLDLSVPLVYCSAILQCDLRSFRVHLLFVLRWGNNDRRYDSPLFYGRRSSLSHTPDRQLGLCPRLTAGLMCLLFTVDMCVFPWGVGE